MPITVVDASGTAVTTGAACDPCYRASATAVSLGNAGDQIIIKGSSTKIVRIRRIELGGVAPAASAWAATLIRRSADATGGVAVAPTVAKLDTDDAAATATVRH